MPYRLHTVPDHPDILSLPYHRRSFLLRTPLIAAHRHYIGYYMWQAPPRMPSFHFCKTCNYSCTQKAPACILSLCLPVSSPASQSLSLPLQLPFPHHPPDSYHRIIPLPHPLVPLLHQQLPFPVYHLHHQSSPVHLHGSGHTLHLLLPVHKSSSCPLSLPSNRHTPRNRSSYLHFCQRLHRYLYHNPYQMLPLAHRQTHPDARHQPTLSPCHTSYTTKTGICLRSYMSSVLPASYHPYHLHPIPSVSHQAALSGRNVRLRYIHPPAPASFLQSPVPD